MAKKKEKQDASGSGQGYLYQFFLALCVALEKYKEDIDLEVNIENYDDIAFESDGDPVELIQAKHYSTPKNLADSSVDLWKTLSIWIDRDKKYLKQGITLNYILASNSTYSNDSGIENLRSKIGYSRNVNKAEEILSTKAKNLIAVETADYRKKFLSLSKEKRKSLLERITVIDATPSISDIRDYISKNYLLPVLVEHRIPLLDRFFGWWLQKIIELLKDSTKTIPVRVISKKLQDLSYEFHNENLPIDFLDSEPDWDIDWDKRVFVHQVKFITDKSTRIQNAIRDFHRAFDQRSRWAREDLLIDDEVETYEKKLVDEWQRFKDSVLDELAPESDEDKKKVGVKIYNWMEQNANIPLRTHVKEEYVARGSYQMLSDEKRVGWHPDFVDRLKELLEE